MTRNVIDWLDEAAFAAPDKSAFEDELWSFTFGQLRERARQIGSYLAKRVEPCRPVLLLMDKTPAAVAAMLGTIYAGCFYTPMDATMPQTRMGRIASQLNPACIVCESKYLEQSQALCDKVYVLSDIQEQVDEALLALRKKQHIDTDMLYVLFTSGSTGTPKGVAISHQSVIDFIDWAQSNLGIEPGSRIGNQAPLYFDNSVLDIYCGIKTRSCVVFLPQMDFAFPKRLLEKLESNRIDTLFWVPSALTAVAASGLLNEKHPKLERIFFCGEVMPCKTLNIWRRAYPEARFINMYGPTEITDVCTWFLVDREFDDNDALPIGFPCGNTRVTLKDGEICVSGTCLARGYYNDLKRTQEAFIQAPTGDTYYKTGDLGAYNDRGELMFLGRRDSQIKRRGYRIELGEIECALLSLNGIQDGCCYYDEQSEQIRCAYTGSLAQKQVKTELKRLLPKYMVPDVYIKLTSMPKTGSGKIDRMGIRQVIGNEHTLP